MVNTSLIVPVLLATVFAGAQPGLPERVESSSTLQFRAVTLKTQLFRVTIFFGSTKIAEWPMRFPLAFPVLVLLAYIALGRWMRAKGSCGSHSPSPVREMA